MAQRTPSPPEPARESLREVRRALLRLHKTLIDFERAQHERTRGPLTSTAFLQALLQDERFGWLRGFSELIIQIDERLAERDRPLGANEARGYLEQVRVRLPPSEPGAQDRYAEARDASSDVEAAHVELTRRLATAGAEEE